MLEERNETYLKDWQLNVLSALFFTGNEKFYRVWARLLSTFGETRQCCEQNSVRTREVYNKKFS
jgi:hypothetical protein